MVAKQFIHAAAACARCPCLRHWVFFLQAPEDGFRIDDTRLAAVQIVLFALDTHALLSAISICEELSTVSATKVGHRRTCAVPFLPAGRRCETSEREEEMSIGVLQEYREQSGLIYLYTYIYIYIYIFIYFYFVFLSRSKI